MRASRRFQWKRRRFINTSGKRYSGRRSKVQILC